MKKIKSLSIMLLIIALTFSGCKKADNPTEPTTTTDITNPTGQPMPSFANQTDVLGVMASVYYYMAVPIAGLPDIATSAASAIFNNGVDAGAVTVNNYTLGKLNAGGKIYYMAPDVNNPMNQLNLSWNGATHSWNVAGGNGIPAISGSVKSPFDYSVSQPTANASVTKANGITVKWTNTSSTTKTLVQIVNLKDKGQAKVYQELADNGSFTIPAADLSSFSGDCMLFVVKYNYNILTVSGKKYVLVSEVVKSINIKVN
ncbi:MAG: hypothetical protein HZA74_04875 [Ignavibacteriales bacterium]|nr:hypothetical protein [Ignavibacteriales bacterium]